MKNALIALIAFHSFPALAGHSCNLKVLTTSAYSGGITWNYLKYDSSLEECDQLCKNQKALEAEVDAYDLVMSCKMTYKHPDGSETVTKYRFMKF